MSDLLTARVQNQFTQLYTKTQESNPTNLNDLLNTIFAPDVKITYNHEVISLDKYKDILTEEMFAVTKTDIEFKDIADLAGEGDQSQVTLVAGCFIVTRFLKFRIRAAPAETQEHIVFSAKVIGTQTEEGEDNRRISEILQTSLNKQVPIKLTS